MSKVSISHDLYNLCLNCYYCTKKPCSSAFAICYTWSWIHCKVWFIYFQNAFICV